MRGVVRFVLQLREQVPQPPRESGAREQRQRAVRESSVREGARDWIGVERALESTREQRAREGIRVESTSVTMLDSDSECTRECQSKRSASGQHVSESQGSTVNRMGSTS